MASKSSHLIHVKEKGAKKAQKNINGLNGSLGGLAKKQDWQQQDSLVQEC